MEKKYYYSKLSLNIVYTMLLNDCIPLTLVRKFVTQYEYTTSFILFPRKKNCSYDNKQSLLFAIRVKK